MKTILLLVVMFLVSGIFVLAEKPVHFPSTNRELLVTRDGDPKLNEIYDTYNRLYFGGKLPNEIPIGFLPSDMVCPSGCLGSVVMLVDGTSAIFISEDLKIEEKFVRLELLKQMAYMNSKDFGGYGKSYRKRMRKLFRQGALENIW